MGTPSVGTPQHLRAAGKRVSLLRCPQLVLPGSPKPRRGRLSKMLAAIPMWEPRMPRFPRRSRSHGAVWQSHLPPPCQPQRHLPAPQLAGRKHRDVLNDQRDSRTDGTPRHGVLVLSHPPSSSDGGGWSSQPNPGWDRLPSPRHRGRKRHLPPRLLSCLLLLLERGQARFGRKSIGTESCGGAYRDRVLPDTAHPLPRG